MSRIAAIGDNCVDVYTNLQQGYPGGGALNYAVHARRAGTEAAYIGVVGDDEYGHWIAEALAAEGVETKYLIHLLGGTALAFVRLVATERTFVGSDHGVREQLSITRDMDDYLSTFDLIHTTLDGGVDEHIPAWHRAGRKISYDFSHRATPDQVALLPHLWVAFFSGQQLDEKGARAKLTAYQKQGAGIVVMTLGGGGSIAFDGNQTFRQPALPTTVVDALGAGDAFQAGFMVEYLESESVQRALYAGASRAAMVCSHYGAFGHAHSLKRRDPRVQRGWNHKGDQA
jgi:fructoselysine 6-kinase